MFRSLVLVLLIVGLVQGVAAADTWYYHPLNGPEGAGDWLMVRQQGKTIRGVWFRLVPGDDGRLKTEAYLFDAKPAPHRWAARLRLAENPAGAALKMQVICPGAWGKRGPTPRVGDNPLLMTTHGANYEGPSWTVLTKVDAPAWYREAVRNSKKKGTR